MDPETARRRFVETYSSASELSEWELVQQYQQVLEYIGAHPDQGSDAVAKALDLPRSRIRTWVDEDGRPDAVRGLQVAESNGWLPTVDNEIPTELRQLGTWVLAAGSISTRDYRPRFVLSDADAAEDLASLLEVVGTGMRRENRAPGRSVEGVPAQDATVLGRVLVTFGVPQGSTITDLETVPVLLTNASDDAQRAYVDTYLRRRGEYWEWIDMWVITHQEAPESYLRALANWLSCVTGIDCETTTDAVHLPAHAVEKIR